MPMCSHNIPLEEKCSRCLNEGLKREDERPRVSRHADADQEVGPEMPPKVPTRNAFENRKIGAICWTGIDITGSSFDPTEFPTVRAFTRTRRKRR
jgi:hypothetical protein